jgi:hypothetical protein
MNRERALRKIKWLTWLFIIGLVVGGATAIPLEWELNLAARLLGAADYSIAQAPEGFTRWILKVREAVHESNAIDPFMAYGTDWLAFGHFVIAIAFVGALRDPVRNRWLFAFGMIACVLVIPYALVFGAIRGIPIFWRFIDCSFGVFGFVPMWLCHRWAREMESLNLKSRPERN